MPKTHVVTSIDIGTEKICTLIASRSPDTGALQVLGISSVPSKGIRKSQVVDLEDAIDAITKSLDGAERMAGFGISSAYVSISGTHVSSQNSKGVVAVANPDGEITATDVSRVIDAARAISLPSSREIIHVIPREFQVDGQTGIKDPIGMSGVRLEAEAHIITGLSPAMRNLNKCLTEVGISIKNFVFSGLASSYAVLSETERELGVVCLDIGAGSMAMTVFAEGGVIYSAVFPVGARHITQDIALGTHISLASAEKLKLHLSTMPPESPAPAGETREQRRERLKKEDEIDAKKLDIDDVEKFSRRILVENIMVPRMKEMFEMVGKELEKEKLFPLIPAGIVITGGGALTVGMVEVCKRTLSLSTRIGTPKGVRGLIEDIDTPQYATAVGTILYGVKDGGEEIKQQTGGNFGQLAGVVGGKGSWIVRKVVELVKSLLP